MVTKKTDQIMFGDNEFVMVGQFPLRKEGSLKISELRWIEKSSRRQIQMAKPLMELALFIAKAEGISDREALAAVQDGESNQYYALKYAERFGDLADSQHTELDQKVELSMMMLNSRVDKMFLVDNSSELFDRYGLIVDKATNQIKELGDLPESILDGVLEFTANERNKWVKPAVIDEPEPTLGE